MKKLLTCLFTLLMAIAVLSPVSMKAAENDVRVKVQLSELDTKDGIKLVGDKSYTVTASAITTVQDLLGLSDESGVKSLVNFDKASGNKDDYTVSSFVVKQGNIVYADAEEDNGEWGVLSANLSGLIKSGSTITVEIGFELDVRNGGNDVDDRNEVAVTVAVPKEFDNSTYYAVSKSSTIYVEKGSNVAKLAEDEELPGGVELPGWNQTDIYDDETDEYYTLVYPTDLTNVTKDTTVYAKWVKQDDWGVEVARFKNPLDANGDGVVTCEEAHGKGWVWDDAKGCVYTAGSTIIVNTATK